MYKILIADDEATITTQLEERMEYMGYNVVGVASSGEEVIEMAKALKPDIILMDIVMSGKFDGIEASQIIKTELDIPVIFITAYADDNLINKATDVEPFGYIVKPFHEKEIKAAIEIGIFKKKIERALQESEKRFKELANLLPQTVFETDDKGKIIYANNTGLNLFGYTQKDIEKGIKFPELFIKKDTVKINKLFPDIRKGKIIKDNEYTAIKKDGTKFPVQVFSSPIKKDNKCIGLRGIVIDITEKKQVEKELRESEIKYRQLAETAKDVILLLDLKGNIKYVNQEGLRLSGYNKNEALKMNINDVLPANLLADSYERFSKRSAGDTGISNYKMEFFNKKGNKTPVEIKSSLITTNDKPSGVLIIARDITERLQTEKALQVSEKKYRMVLEQSVESIYLADFQTKRIIETNKSLQNMLGYSEEEIKRLTAYDFVAHSRDDIESKIELLLKRKQAFIGERKYRKKDGTLVNVDVTASIITLGDKKVICVVSRDITERKKTEKTLRFLSSVTEQVTDSIVITNTDFEIIYINKATEKLYNYSQNELIGKTPEILNAEPLAHEIQKDIYDTVSSGNIWRGEHLNRKKDGSTFICEFKISPLKDEQGKISFYLDIQHDITKRKQIEEALTKYREHLEDIVKERTAELQESEKKYRTLFESSRDAIMMLAPPDWLFIAGNPATIKMIKAKDEKEFISKSPWELSPEYQPDGQLSSEKANKMIETAMKTGSHFFEWTHKRLDGNDFPATVLLTRIELEGKKLLQATVRDITERKQAEEELKKYREHLEELVEDRTAELKKSEEKYRTLAENMNVGLYRDTVGQKGNFIEINPALVKIFGYKNREEVFRLNVSDLYQNPEDRNVFNQKILKTGFVKNEELNLKKKDGSTLICSVSAVAVKDENGKVKYYDGIIDDVTERKKAEKALQEREEHFRSIFETAKDSIFIKDTKLKYIQINPTMEKLFGLSSSKLIGLSDEDLFGKEAGAHIREVDSRVLNGEVIEEENTKPVKGIPTTFHVIKVPMRIKSGEIIGLCGIARDVTERKRAEEKLHKYADTQKVLLQEVNHRVKNNLTAILGLLNMEEAKTKNKDNLTFINELKGQIRGLSTVHSLLSESGWGPLNLNLLCEQVIIASLSCFPNSNLVVFNVSPTKIRVNSDQAHHLAIAINELITNSLKYGQNQKNEIRLKVDFTKNKENVTITYKDSGKGYPQKLIDGDFSNVGVGYDLIKGIVTQSLMGKLQIYNDNGAVTSISFINLK